MVEKISIKATDKTGKSTNYDWYENNSASKEDCFDTESDLVWYVLESIANDERFTDAIRIEAEETLEDRGKIISRITATVRND